MKRFHLSFLMLTIMVLSAFGQGDHGYNLYGQLGGTATGLGIGFDSRFKTGGVLGYSVGVAFTNISWKNDYDYRGPYDGYSFWHVDSKGITIPLEINAILGKRTSKFEIGLGATAYLINRDEIKDSSELVYIDEETGEYDFKEFFEHKEGFRPNIVGSLSIGYRLQRKSGFFMKIGLSFIIADMKFSPLDGLLPFPNLCFGYTIPHF